MKKLNWNQISELGLLERINKEIMHPLGLAVYRETETGNSGGALVADDGVWEYAPGTELKNFSDDEVRRMIDDMTPTSTKRQRVSYPSGQGVLITDDLDIHGVVIALDDDGAYRRVHHSAMVKIQEGDL